MKIVHAILIAIGMMLGTLLSHYELQEDLNPRETPEEIQKETFEQQRDFLENEWMNSDAKPCRMWSATVIRQEPLGPNLFQTKVELEDDEIVTLALSGKKLELGDTVIVELMQYQRSSSGIVVFINIIK